MYASPHLLAGAAFVAWTGVWSVRVRTRFLAAGKGIPGGGTDLVKKVEDKTISEQVM